MDLSLDKNILTDENKTKGRIIGNSRRKRTDSNKSTSLTHEAVRNSKLKDDSKQKGNGHKNKQDSFQKENPENNESVRKSRSEEDPSSTPHREQRKDKMVRNYLSNGTSKHRSANRYRKDDVSTQMSSDRYRGDVSRDR